MSETPLEGIAIIGIHGRFPGADSVEALWANLIAGKESISFFSDDELAAAGLDPIELRRRGNYVPARGVLKDVDCFDAAFFGVQPKEAEVMDPQQRVFLESCWEALERAGYPPDRAPGTVGVFAGATFNTYYLHALHPRADLRELVGREQVMLGNEKDYLTTRVAYKLNLRGPAISINTACSSSLVAVCQACQSLMTYQCSMALAGGVSVRVPQVDGYYHQEGNIAAIDGHTRSFDTDATGTVFSNGITLVVLKRLDEAVADGDEIYAVIKGTALNNDGSQRVSFGAPGVDGQSEAISLAQEIAGVDADSISYVEAHGTATPMGDPIEVAALTKAFRRQTQRRQFCGIGSIKTNIGHLDAAAGTAGLIKVALAMKHRLLPPSLHYRSPNPRLELESTPFYVNATLRTWESANGTPLRAGVSSFGTGGTNAHVVVEEPPVRERDQPSSSPQLLVLSAKTATALEAATTNLAAHLRQNPADAFADVAYTLQVGRSEFIHRRVVVCEDEGQALALLEKPEPRLVFTGRQELKDPAVVFMFPGQGAQYIRMGAELYQAEPSFRDIVDRCAEILTPLLGLDLRTLLFGDKQDGAEEKLQQTRYTQPALFVVEYALAQLWISWGITPTSMIGHSVGEYVAGCLAGVFPLETALELVARRAQLVQALPHGAMMAVRLSEDALRPLLPINLSIAAINSPTLCVVSGPTEEIDAFERQLATRKIAGKRLDTSHAFHSLMMEAAVAPFVQLLRAFRFQIPTLPFVSNVTGKWITPQEATSPEYWASHLRQPVRFSDGLTSAIADGHEILLEVGPGNTLAQLARQHPARKTDQLAISSLGHSKGEELKGMLSAVGRIWIAGHRVEWTRLHHTPRRRVVLPTYPFERKRFWPEPAVSRSEIAGGVVKGDINEVRMTSAQLNSAANAMSPDLTPIPAPAVASNSRRERLLSQSRALLQELSGITLEGTNPATEFIELGLDSLILTQAALLLRQKFGVTITFRQLMEEVSSLESVAAFLDSKMPPEVEATAPSFVHEPAPRRVPSSDASSQSSLEKLLVQQVQLTNQLLALVQRGDANANNSNVVSAQVSLGRLKVEPPLIQPKESATEAKPFGPFRGIENRTSSGALSSEQQRFLSDFIPQYTKRTLTSKQRTQRTRKVLADPRTVIGFRPYWKEMVYPLVIERSLGSRIWDVDGNEYVDFSMGFGTNLLGHSPDNVIAAIGGQLKKGIEVGPQTPLAGEVAHLMCELTGMERCAFANTGSEAVLAAIRLARTVTGRPRIVYFTGDYHGIFDEVLQRPTGTSKLLPVAPGIPQQSVEHLTILEYDRPESLDAIRALGSELAAVLVEPVQSRHPDHQPREFLRALRALTEEIGSALIFDEVITGFRCHPGGAQALFGVKADLASYGKIVGGGMPIGALCGSARFMDALDGGFWSYGDDSVPESGVTFFAGTYIRHPLAMAGAWALLDHLKRAGPQLQSDLSARMSNVVGELNRFLLARKAPLHVEHFSSFFWLRFEPGVKFGSLLFFLLRDKGIHIFEGRLFFLSTAHHAEDENRLIDAFKASIVEMQNSNFLPGPQTGTSQESLTKTALGAVSESAGTPLQIPLSDAQRGLWMFSKLSEAGNRAYTEFFTTEVRGALDRPTLKRALQCLVDRHEALRATIAVAGENQTIRPHAEIAVQEIDLSTAPDEAREGRLAEEYRRIEATVFDFTNAPTLNAWLIRLQPDLHVVVLMLHHTFGNGPSNSVLMDELWSVYDSFARGVPAKLEPAMQLSDYIRRSEELRKSAAYESDRAFWLNRFSGSIPVLDLPCDRPRPPTLSFRGARSTLILDSRLTADVRKTCGRLRSSLFVVLKSAFTALLSRISGQPDIIVGVPFEGDTRQLPGGKSLVANTTNLIPIRSKLGSDEPFSEFATRTKSEILEANEHQTYFFGNLVHDLKLRHDPSRSPIVAVSFNVERGTPPRKVGSLQTSFVLADAPCANPRGTSKFELAVNIVDLGHELQIDCDFLTDLFEPATISRWLQHFRTLLNGVTENPDSTIAELPLLTETERQEIIHLFDTERQPATRGIPADGGKTLHELFEQAVAANPKAPAVTCDGVTLTYAELNIRANRIARRLIKLGVKPDVLVGLCLERNSDIIVAILAILKAGGAYLPIDLTYPPERLAFMLGDARAPVILTEEKLLAKIPATAAQPLCVDRLLAEKYGTNDDVNLPATASPDHLAYVIYTSGTTGQPKGSLITHRNVSRLFAATDRWFGFNSKDVWTLFHSTAFDFSVWEIWGSLLYGGRLVVIPFLVSRSPEAFYQLLVKEQVTVLNQTPSAFRQLIQAEAQCGQQSPALRYVIFGGEALEMQSLQPWFSRHGDEQPRLINMYGITETTVHVTYRPLSKTDLTAASVIGQPIPDLQVYILDSKLNVLPLGVPGEMYVGGAGLARGYLNRPDLTAERFIADQISGASGRRLYRTGDLARLTSNRDIEYLGRLDHQVKLRGFRIELGEIESTLSQHGAVREVTVIAREDVAGDKRLVAYLVARGDAVDSHVLRDHLKRTLPEYMVPSAFVWLPALPLTNNGKIDRRALPLPDQQRPELSESFLLPQSPTEKVVAQIWSEVLQLERVGARDNFFELGGHSLLALKVVSRIRQHFGIDIPLSVMFETASLAELGERIAKLQLEEMDKEELSRLLEEIETGPADNSRPTAASN